METKKEKWIDQLLDISTEIQQVPLPYSIIHKLYGVPENKLHIKEMTPAKTIWLTTAGIALLILLNFVIINRNTEFKSGYAEIYFSYISPY